MKKILIGFAILIGLYASSLLVYNSGVIEAWRPLEPATIQQLYADTNRERVSRGLPELVLNPDLNDSASDKCQDMLNKDYWAHTSPDGKQPWDFIAVHTDYEEAGENLARGYNNPSAIIDGWMDSPTHRDNILKSYTDVGFAICGEHVVQHFITE